MDFMQEGATELIRPLISKDAEDRVKRTVKQWNGMLRKQVRELTGLRLSDHDSIQSIPVRVVDGFSVELGELIDRYNDPILWKLIVGQPKIGEMVAGVEHVLGFWGELRSWDKFRDEWGGSDQSLAHVRNLGLFLQRLAIAEKVQAEIRGIPEDYLGAYFYGRESKIEIYWMAIAMIAAMIGVRIEDLTIVVLAHELAHGYSHLGKDIDGGEWTSEGFLRSDIQVKEGIAQFYTHVITENLANQMPGPQLAYEALLAMQEGPYLSHLTWLHEHPDRTGEIVRFTLVATRSSGAVEHTDWLEQMRHSSSSLRNKKKSSV